MVHFYVGPSETVVGPLLQIKRVKFVSLCRRAGHKTIENGRIVFNARAMEKIRISHDGRIGSLERREMNHVKHLQRIFPIWKRRFFGFVKSNQNYLMCDVDQKAKIVSFKNNYTWLTKIYISHMQNFP